MDYSPSAKELSHFPFLKKAQDHVRGRFSTLDSLLADPRNVTLVELSVARVRDAMVPKKTPDYSVAGSPEEEIAGYALARIIVSCVNDRQLIDRLTRFEAERAYHFLVSEEEWNPSCRLDESGYSRLCIALAGELGVPVLQDRMPLAEYVELVAPLHEDRYHLVNRRVGHGFVEIRRGEGYELLRERIRFLLRQGLPHKVPTAVCDLLAPRVADLKRAYQEQMLQQFGAIEENAFPPCMQALIRALTAGTNLTHAGRFALTTFVHTIGMDVPAIAKLYARSPDFDPEKTMYQVEHITGRGGSGTEYTAPACAAMRTTGLCVRRDSLCEIVNHPLSYYRAKKRDLAHRPKKKEENEQEKPVPST